MKLKSYVFELEITGLGETEVEAKHDAVQQLTNGSYSTPNELYQWLDLKRVEDIDDEEESK